MTLPDEIEIQVTDTLGQVSSTGKLLFGLKIFDDDNGSWYNYSTILSDTFGQVNLTRKDMILHTGIDENILVQNTFPTRVELYVWTGEETENFKKAVERIIEISYDRDLIRRDLINHKVRECDIESAIDATQAEFIRQKNLYEPFKNVNNSKIRFVSDKISDIWTSSQLRKYIFQIEKGENCK